MAPDLYGPCPCGSGKKFKWCCQPIHVQITKAFQQDAEGQHATALRLMEELTSQHADNPEAWGRKAQLLYQNDRMDEAETALQKALDLNPNYPFGYLLRGDFRRNEGEIAGALLLFRKAADLYDPEARDILGQVYMLIADCELRLNRPVAARAALKIALRYQPGNEQLRQDFETAVGDKSPLPAVARRDYTFQSPPAMAPAERRTAWDAALAGAATAKLTAAARAFEQLATQDPDDAAAWYNLGLVRSWLGDNAGSLEALDRYVALEADEARAAAAWALAEVLRLGQGMEDQADYVEHSVLFQLRDPERVISFLQEWERRRRLVGVRIQQDQGLVTGLVLERPPALTPELAATQLPGVGANLLIVRDALRLWNVNEAALDSVRRELQEAVGPALSGAAVARGHASFGDVMLESLAFPVGITDQAEAEKRVREHAQRFFEETWIHRPLRSLNRIAPIDAAGHVGLRKKLLGVVQFLEECATSGPQAYDFGRLRRKLGLLPPEAPTVAAVPAASPADVSAMSAAELAALKPESLANEQLEQAYQAALQLDARELAGHFARALVARPLRPERPDSYPWYSHLVQLALAEGDTDAALDSLNAGEQADCEHNEGRRRNDYELRRGQIHAKRGEADQAQDIFDRLIERAPAEMRYRSTAAETMLSARQGARALRFAEQGLAEARKRNDRDSEEHFQELVGAARKVSGG
jgi:tetratricopeptide (TPR) repeat protein